MPRIIRGLTGSKNPQHPALVKRLAQELKATRGFGQPRIEEVPFPNGALKIAVLWDKWEKVPGHERADVILRAYELSEGKAYRDRIALAIGLTFPEAYELGLLPYRLEPAPHKGEARAAEEYYQAMTEEGASKLFDGQQPVLRFATEEEMESSRARLRARFGNRWVATKEFTPTEG
jgi:hypothetical protein